MTPPPNKQIVFALRVQYKAAVANGDCVTECSVSISISNSYSKAGKFTVSSPSRLFESCPRCGTRLSNVL